MWFAYTNTPKGKLFTTVTSAQLCYHIQHKQIITGKSEQPHQSKHLKIIGCINKGEYFWWKYLHAMKKNFFFKLKWIFLMMQQTAMCVFILWNFDRYLKFFLWYKDLSWGYQKKSSRNFYYGNTRPLASQVKQLQVKTTSGVTSVTD